MIFVQSWLWHADTSITLATSEIRASLATTINLHDETIVVWSLYVWVVMGAQHEILKHLRRVREYSNYTFRSISVLDLPTTIIK